MDETLTLTALATIDTTDATKYQPLSCRAGTSSKGMQSAVVGVWLTDGTAGDTGVLRFVLRDGTSVYTVREATITVNAQVQPIAGTGTTKTATVAFANGSDIMDMGGATFDGSMKWYVGLVTKPAGTTTLDTSHPVKLNMTYLTGSAG